ncbi:MAG: hypothetical protein AB1938_29405 [Myxococcota bacterium]
MPPAPSKTPSPSQAAKKPRFPVPWGLFIVLGVYALGVLAFVKFQYWDSPQYQAAEHYARALYLLGVDDGRKCSEAQLTEAMKEVLDAARLMPDEIELAKHTERLRFRFEERKFKIPKDLERHAELVSATAQRREREKDPWLVVGVRDRGWGPEQLLGGPRRAVLWSIPGGVLIILIWAYGRFSARAVREREHEDDLKKSEAEVKELGQFREGLKQAPSKYAAPDDDEGGDTLADPPKRVPSRPGAKAVSRPPTGSGAKAVARPASSPGRPGVSRPPSSSGRPAVKKRPPGGD